MRKLLAVLFSLLFATSLAACGSDDADESGSGSGSGSVEADAADDDETTTTESGDDETTTTERDDDVEVSGDFCEQARIFATDESLANLDFRNPEDVARGVEVLESFRDASPDEIKDDLQIVIDGFQLFAETMAAAGDDPEAQAAAAAELEDEFAAIEAASVEVQDFTLAECDIDITGGAATTTTTTP